MFANVFQNLIKLLILYIVLVSLTHWQKLIKSFDYKLELFITFKIIIAIITL